MELIVGKSKITRISRRETAVNQGVKPKTKECWPIQILRNLSVKGCLLHQQNQIMHRHAKSAFDKQFELGVVEELIKCCICSIALYRSETWTQPSNKLPDVIQGCWREPRYWRKKNPVNDDLKQRKDSGNWRRDGERIWRLSQRTCRQLQQVVTIIEGTFLVKQWRLDSLWYSLSRCQVIKENEDDRLRFVFTRLISLREYNVEIQGYDLTEYICWKAYTFISQRYSNYSVFKYVKAFYITKGSKRQ